MKTRLGFITFLTSSTASLQDQVASSRQNTGDSLPGAPGETMASIGAPGLDQVGGFAVQP